MFCAHCGGPAAPGDRYCGSCGEPVASASALAPLPAQRQEPRARQPRQPLSRKTRILAASVLGAAVLTGAVYAVAHFTYGPSSPQALQAKAEAAVEAGDAAGLSRLLAPGQQALKNQEALDAFDKSLDKPEVKEQYKTLLADAADQAGTQPNPLQRLFSGDSVLAFESEKSWRGTRWRLQVEPAEIAIVQAEGITVEGKLAEGGPAAADNRISGLWPSIYRFEGTVRNDYASETVTDTVSLLQDSGAEIRPAELLSTSLTVELPRGQGYTVTLNGKEISALNGELELAPAPAKASFQVKANVLGTELEASLDVDAAQTQRVELDGLLNGKMAEQALEAAYGAALSWTEARNSGDPSLLKAADPASPYAVGLSKEITQPAENRVQLVKVLVDPSSIQWDDGDSLQVSVREMYHLERQPDGWFSTQDPVSDHSYTLKRAGDGSGWWIDTDNGSAWFDDIEALVKENAGAST